MTVSFIPFITGCAHFWTWNHWKFYYKNWMFRLHLFFNKRWQSTAVNIGAGAILKARTLYLRAPPCPLTFKTGGARAPVGYMAPEPPAPMAASMWALVHSDSRFESIRFLKIGTSDSIVRNLLVVGVCLPIAKPPIDGSTNYRSWHDSHVQGYSTYSGLAVWHPRP